MKDCPDTFWNNPNEGTPVCSECDSACLHCVGAADHCTYCNHGEYAVNGLCITCPDFCVNGCDIIDDNELICETIEED